ncbi:MAG: histidine--tRNA ligase [Bacteroidota bacterium]
MKPSLPKGTRDFTPQQTLRRQYIFQTIQKVFVKYGFQPIETPAMESLSTLTGKYGEEGDQLLFKVLNNGDFLSKANAQALEARDSAALVSSISKRGLRYDLTVPFARFVVMNQNDLTFPFKRYQIQPVWRADRPQKGRYQEFYQCDVDVVGSDSLLFEAELTQIYDEVFTALQLPVVVKLNNRKILAGMAEAAGIGDRFVEMTMAIDKLDKIGVEGVKKELSSRGIDEQATEKIEQVLAVKELSELSAFFADSETGQKGIEELKTVFDLLSDVQLNNQMQFDVTLARGLNYYTGCIFEVKVDTAAHPDIVMGSIGGGGRYDDLTGVFGMKDMSGVGVSFGAERIYDVLEELNLYPETVAQNLKVVILTFDKVTFRYGFKILQQLRTAGIAAELYPEPTKMKKQMKYANGRDVPYTIVIGSQEMESGELSLKHMKSGEQEKLNIESIVDRLS